MNKSKIFFWFLISFIFGVGMRSFFDIPFTVIFFTIIISIAILTIFWKEKYATLVAFLILFFIFGVYTLERSLNRILDYPFLEKEINMNVIVTKEPERKESYQKLIVKADSEKVLINTALYPEYSYGDELKVNCVMKIPKNRDEKFDYRMYLAKDGIRYICDNADIEKISEKSGNIFYSSILKIKNTLEDSVSKSIPEPQASLANGVLFGGSGSMSKEVQENFSKTGMTHIIAVSGYNVTIIAEYLVLVGIFLGLWRKQALWFAIIGIVLFVAMIGFPSSAVRAGVMGTVLIWAMKSGRLSNSQNAIIFAGAIMLFLNPLLLRYDAGFQLSFLATLGIIQFSPFIEKISFKKNDPIGLLEIIFLTISAQIFVLPIIIYNFGTVSLVSLFANILILPVVPISMLLSFMASISGVFVAPSFNVFAWLAYLPLKYEIGVIDYLATFSWSSIVIENMSVFYIIAYYLILLSVIFFIKNKNEK